MIAAISLIMVLAMSILITRIATIALIQTGLARETAKFQARSAFTGVGFTTNEAEKVVNHPVRRRILMLLMLMGNAGIVTAVSTAILSFAGNDDEGRGWMKLALLVAGLSLLWTASYSQWLDKHLSRLISWFLEKYTDIDVRDYASILKVGGDYQIAELQTQEGDWLAGRNLADLKLRREGVAVLGIQKTGGEYLGVPMGTTTIKAGDTLLLYGRSQSIKALDERREGVGGQLAHMDAIAEQQKIEDAEAEKTVAADENNSDTTTTESGDA